MSTAADLILAALLFLVFGALAIGATIAVARGREDHKLSVLDEQQCRELVAPISAVSRCERER
jgi:hypothetical protein